MGIKEFINPTAIGNLKAVGEQSSMVSNVSYSNSVSNTNLGAQNQVSNQMAKTSLVTSVVGKVSNQISNSGPMEARSAVDVLTNNELAQAIMGINAGLAAFKDEVFPVGSIKNPIKGKGPYKAAGDIEIIDVRKVPKGKALQYKVEQGKNTNGEDVTRVVFFTA